MNYEYEIKYLKQDVIERLEKYLHEVTLHDLKKEYFFKFDIDRKNITVNNKDDRNVTLTLKDFVDQTWQKLNIFFRFEKVKPEDGIIVVENEFTELMRKEANKPSKL